MNAQNASLESIGACYRRQAFAEAEAMADDLVSSRPGDANLLVALGRLAMQHRCDAEALRRFDEALTLRPNEAALHVLRGHALVRLGRWPEAIGSLERASVLAPGSEELAVAVAQAFVNMGRNDEALRVLLKLRGHKPGLGQYAKLFLARLLSEAKRFDEAGAIYDEVVAAAPTDVQAILGYASFLAARKREEEAERLLREALAREPSSEKLRGMLAHLFEQQGRHEEVAEQFRAILALRPGDVLAKWKLVQALVALGRLDEARAEYEVLRRQYPEILERIGREGVPGQARPHPDKVIALPTPEAQFVRGWHTRLQRCDWTDYERNLDLVRGIIERMDLPGDPAESSHIDPYHALLLPLDEELRLAVAKNYSRHIRAELDRRGQRLPPCPRRSAAGRRLRIGYVSPDFRAHAVAFLAKRLFELHDRERFEVFGYSLQPSDRSDERAVIERGCDHFADIFDLGNADAARLIRDDGIDILVDLAGYTKHCRPEVMALRPAPVQVQWIGYQGSLGADWIDYCVSTRNHVPSESESLYSEKLAFLPDTWLPLSGYDEGQPTSRGEQGLPEDVFIYCCFQRVEKIDPDLFSIWMNILRRVPGSVLWLLSGGRDIEKNLVHEAEKHGVDARNRLIFAGKLKLADHIARQRVADLFLNTMTYSGTTTVSAALWAGLPVLAMRGFNAVTTTGAIPSLLCGMPDMVVDDLEQYEDRAVEYGSNPEKTYALRRRLEETRARSIFFDAPRTVRHLERAYELMWARYEQGLPAESFEVPVL